MDLYVLISDPSGVEEDVFFPSDQIVHATFTNVGDTINDMTAGRVDIWFEVSSPEQGVLLGAGST